ncbi:MAG: response regulator transcription factor [Actinomycetota bacterium]|nr:response regulator transcription factor [Actinomycetota bacterium]
MRVTLADDSVLVREGLARLLQDHGMEVIAQAGTAEELIDLVGEDPPDIAVVDIRMPPTHTDEGLRAAETIRASHPDVAVLVLSQHLNTRYAVKLITEGTDRTGYLLKERVAQISDLVDVMQRLAEGESVIDPDIVSLLMARKREHDPLAALSDREREVLTLMAEGRSNKGICDKLFLSPKTVNTHIHNIFMKLKLDEAPDDHRRVLAVIAYLRG